MYLFVIELGNRCNYKSFHGAVGGKLYKGGGMLDGT